MDLAYLLDQFHAEADKARRYAPGAAQAWEDAAALLQAHVREHDDQMLNLTQAAAESGYSPDSMRRFFNEGLLKDYGGPHRPRVRRGDLPRKPGHRRPPQPSQTDPVPGPDLAGKRLRELGVLPE